MDYCTYVLVLPLTLVPSRHFETFLYFEMYLFLCSFLSQPISDEVRTLCVVWLRAL